MISMIVAAVDLAAVVAVVAAVALPFIVAEADAVAVVDRLQEMSRTVLERYLVLP